MRISHIVLIVSASASIAGAQSIRLADSLAQAGALTRAESLYYAAVRVRPRDPVARWSLGRFLVARGAPRVGATLFEEALQFGGERALVERDLIPVYLQIGEYKPLAALAAASPAERERAQWLAARESRVVAPDSIVVAQFRPSTDTATLGAMPIRVNGRTIDAVITTRIQGILIADTTDVATRVRKFASRGTTDRGRVLAVADSLGIGRVSISNVPVAVTTLTGHQAEIGIDVLGRFSPTFDPKLGHMTLRVGGRPSMPRGAGLTTWTTGSDVRVLQAGGWLSLSHPQMSRLLRDHRWTYDARRGQIIVEP